MDCPRVCPPPSWSDKYLDGWEKPICERKRQKLLTEQKQNGGEKSFWNFSGPCGHAACREHKYLWHVLCGYNFIVKLLYE